MEDSDQQKSYEQGSSEELKGASDIINVAVIFLNSEYKDPKYKTLVGVKSDGEYMKLMLKNAYRKSLKWIEIMSAENTEDIKDKLEKFQTSSELKGKQIERLHFHFSGHGGFDKDSGDNCIVGSGKDAKLNEMEMDIKKNLLGWNSKEISLTIDCCRGNGKLVRQGIVNDYDPTHTSDAEEDSQLVAGWKDLPRGNSTETGCKVSDLKKIFTLYATPNQHTSSDHDSLTKELFLVTEKGERLVAITELAGEVNLSWEGRGISDQISKDDYVKGGAQWKKCFWPVEDKEYRSEKKSSKEPSITEMMETLRTEQSRTEQNLCHRSWLALVGFGLLGVMIFFRK